MDIALEFTNRLCSPLRAERHARAEFLVALAEFDRRGLWRERGHTSLFSFLHRELKLSAGAAQYRKTAAELIRRYPEVESGLREGKLCLSSVCELAKVLTPENCAEVLPRFFGLSSRDAAEVAVSIRPVESPPRREVVVPIRTATPAPARATPAAPISFRAPEPNAPNRVETAGPSASARSEPVELRAVTHATRPSSVDWLDGDQARMHLTVSKAFLKEARRRARRAVPRHAGRLPRRRPRGGAGGAACAARPAEGAHGQAAEDGPSLHAAGPHPRPRPPRGVGAGRRPVHVPPPFRRALWLHHRLELDHIVPRAQGGPSTADNLRIRCRGHNLEEARRVLGDALVDAYAGRPHAGVP